MKFNLIDIVNAFIEKYEPYWKGKESSEILDVIDGQIVQVLYISHDYVLAKLHLVMFGNDDYSDTVTLNLKKPDYIYCIKSISESDSQGFRIEITYDHEYDYIRVARFTTNAEYIYSHSGISIIKPDECQQMIASLNLNNIELNNAVDSNLMIDLDKLPEI